MARVPLRRLTQIEFNNTVADLLAESTSTPVSFVGETKVGPFDLNASGVVTEIVAETYLQAAQSIADRAVAKLDQLNRCAPGIDEAACAREFIRNFGLRAFRRPVAVEEEKLLQQIYSSARTELGYDFRGGMRAVIASMLTSPTFRYLFEFGTGRAVGGKMPLTPYEVASRLSYFVWRSMPDAALLEAAGAGRLGTAEEIGAQVRRMLQAPRARSGAWSFFQQWLELDHLDEARRDPKAFPRFTPTLLRSMARETEQFVQWVMWKGPGSVETLLTARQTFVDAELAAHYGIPAALPGMQSSLGTTDRAGLLTHASLLTAHAKDSEVSAILLRGLLVRTRLLCSTIPDPPADAPPLPASTPGAGTLRHRLEAHTNVAPQCSTCHQLINPIGYGFQNYDSTGRHRTTLDGQPVDSSGELRGTRDADGPFTSARQLGERLGRSAQVRECLANQLWTYAMAQMPSSIDECVRGQAYRAFEQSGLDLRELVAAIATNETFRHTPEVRP